MESLLCKMNAEDRLVLVTCNSRVHMYTLDGDIISPTLKLGPDSNWDEKALSYFNKDCFHLNQVQAFNIINSFCGKSSTWRGAPGPTGTRMHIGLSVISSMMAGNMNSFSSGILTWITDGVSEPDTLFIAKSVEMIQSITRKGVMPIGLVADNNDTVLDSFCKSINVDSSTALRCLHEPRKLAMSFKQLIENGTIELDKVVSSVDFQVGGVERQRSLSDAASRSIPSILRENSTSPFFVEHTETTMNAFIPPRVERQ